MSKTRPLLDPGRQLASRGLPSIFPSWFRKFLAGGTNPSSNTGPYNVTFQLSCERVRFIAYVLFWFMCIFAIIITKFVVNPILEAGDPTGKGCPPFDNGNGPEYQRTSGFNIERSHLKENFGFNNICVNWDYAPSRQLTALVYPLFEYSLILYVILDFILILLSYKNRYVGYHLVRYSVIAFFVQITLCSMFRMIFVAIAYDDVRSHTAGFLCLQLALFSVIIMNVIYVLETGALARFDDDGYRRYHPIFWIYNILNFLSMSIKVYLTAYVVFSWGGKNVYPSWARDIIVGGKAIGQWVDLVWMVFNAIMPLIIATIRNKTEPKIKISLELVDIPKFFKESKS